MDPRAWTPVKGSPIILDFTKCQYYEDFHQVLSMAFGFPAYYGKNPDALWDLLQDFFDDWEEIGPWEVRIKGWKKLTQRVKSDFADYLKVFAWVEEDYPAVRFVWES